MTDRLDASEKYVVRKSSYDASRPYAVMATFRTFNTVIARYADEAAARRRVRDLNKSYADLTAARLSMHRSAT